MLEMNIEALENLVSEIRQVHQNLVSVIEELSHRVDFLPTNWEGEASLAFNEKYKQLQAHFGDHHEMVATYIHHLESIIEQYRLTEQNLKANIEGF